MADAADHTGHVGRPLQVAVGLVVVAVGIAVRVPMLGFRSGDYTTFVARWFDHLAVSGLAGTGDGTSNYEPLYLYLLLGATHLPVAALVAAKAVSVAFDLALAVLAAAVVAWRRPGTWWPVAAGAAVLLAPTVVLNGAEWAQCDSVYAAFALAALAAFVRRRPVRAGALLGLAVAAKLQAVFVIPIAIVVVLVQRLPARRVVAAVVVAPVVFVLTLLPAVAAGASLTGLLTSYPGQVLQGGAAWGATGATGDQAPGPAAGGSRPADLLPAAGGGSARGGFDMADPGFRGGLTYNASSFYQWLPTDAPGWWRGVGLALAGAVLVALGAWALRHRDALGDEHLALLTTTVLIALPFLLPSMHDRYAYLADVATIVVAFVVPRSWPAALLMQVASFVAYASYLWGSSIPLWVGTTAAALALAWSGRLLLTTPLRATVRPRADEERPAVA